MQLTLGPVSREASLFHKVKLFGQNRQQAGGSPQLTVCVALMLDPFCWLRKERFLGLGRVKVGALRSTHSRAKKEAGIKSISGTLSWGSLWEASYRGFVMSEKFGIQSLK